MVGNQCAIAQKKCLVSWVMPSTENFEIENWLVKRVGLGFNAFNYQALYYFFMKTNFLMINGTLFLEIMFIFEKIQFDNTSYQIANFQGAAGRAYSSIAQIGSPRVSFTGDSLHRYPRL